MSSSIDDSLTETLTDTTILLNRYFSLFILFFGVIGNILNMLVLTQRSLRSNSCVLLFLISSIANLISLSSGLTSRIFSSWKMDLTETNNFICKLRTFITFTSRTTAVWLIVLATIDRWLQSSHKHPYRKLSSLKNAQKGSLIVIILSILFYLHMLYCYKANLLNTPLKCYGKTSSCRLLTDITYGCFTVFLPLILMTIFGVMTITNIRQTRSCMVPQRLWAKNHLSSKTLIFLSRQRQRWKKLDRHLRRMLFIQILLLIVLTVPQAIHKIYFTMTSYEIKSPLEYEYDRLLYSFELLLSYLESALPFYIYTLTGGKIFREALKKLLLCSR
jgi:hypothetical protein